MHVSSTVYAVKVHVIPAAGAKEKLVCLLSETKATLLAYIKRVLPFTLFHNLGDGV